MDIAALSIGLSQAKLAQDAGTAVMKVALDTATEQSKDLSKLMEQATIPHLGSNIDVSL